MPNPSRDAATVALTLPQSGAEGVALHDVLGQRVTTLHEGPLGVGRHTLTLDGASLPPGVYVVRVEVGEAVAAVRFTRLRP